MDDKNKEWVFEKLVRDDKDGVGLIAYALYKCEKHSVASNLRDSGTDEDSIVSQLDTFHSQSLTPSRLESFRDKSKSYLNELYEKIEEDIESVYKTKFEKLKDESERKIKKVEKESGAQIKKERRRLLSSLQNVAKENKSYRVKFLEWLSGGLSGALASSLLVVFLYGAIFLVVPEEKRLNIVTAALAEVLGADADKE